MLGLQARPTIAQEEEDQRPRAALAACASGDVKKGIAILAELYAQTRNVSFVFNQGRCYQQNGQFEPARQRFAEYLRVGTNEPAEDIQRAQGFIKEIDEALARQRPPEAAPPVAVTAAPAPAPPPTPSSEGRARHLRTTGIALTALGLVAVGTGVYMSFKVRALQDDVEKRFAMMGIVTDPAALQRELSDGGRYETWQWISYGIGVAALAGAATTFALGGSPFGRRGGAEQQAVAIAPLAGPGTMGGFVRLRF